MAKVANLFCAKPNKSQKKTTSRERKAWWWMHIHLTAALRSPPPNPFAEDLARYARVSAPQQIIIQSPSELEFLRTADDLIPLESVEQEVYADVRLRAAYSRLAGSPRLELHLMLVEVQSTASTRQHARPLRIQHRNQGVSPRSNGLITAPRPPPCLPKPTTYSDTPVWESPSVFHCVPHPQLLTKLVPILHNL